MVISAPDIANLNASGPSSGAATTQAVGEVRLNGGALAGTFVNGESYTTSNGLLITNGGTGYGAGTTITISAPDEGGGTQMTVDSVTVVGGVIKAVVLNNVGAGYWRTPTLTITNDGGAASGAEFNLILEGAVQAINVTTAGTGYSDNPTCTLTGGNGSGFAATTAIEGILDSIAVTAGGVTDVLIVVPSLTRRVRKDGHRHDVQDFFNGRIDLDSLDYFVVGRVELIDFSDGDTRPAVQAFHNDVRSVGVCPILKAGNLIVQF